MIYKFHAYGHPNILGTHKATLEFTRDDELSTNGNCIIGIKADFDSEKIKDFIKKSKDKRIIIIIETADKKIKEIISAELNHNFNHDKELVIRKTDFASERTLAIKANKAAFELNRALIDFLREKGNKVIVIVENN